MNLISDLISKYDLSRFKVFYEQTLFPLNWEALKVKRCPMCSCLLKFPRNNKLALCSSKKHAKPFLISLSKLK